MKAGRDGLKIVFGLVPFFIVAAFLESYVTRHYLQMPAWSKLAILISSLSLITWYFIIYPVQLHKRMAAAEENPAAPADQNFQLWLNKKLNSEK
jgi:hypothetical protein